MSHIVKEYAKELGVKIGKPIITEHFFPVLNDKYITLHQSTKSPSANYKYWDLVIRLLRTRLGDIKVVQVGGPEDKPISHCDEFTLGASFKQMNYIIKQSLAHVGCDSVPGHVASVYNVPTVTLHHNLYPESSKPIFHEKNISLSPDYSEIKPSFSDYGNRINEIKAEDVANSILEHLNLPKVDFKTIYVGSGFENETVEIVPDFFGYSDALKGQPINLRADLHFDLNNIIEWCKWCVVSLVLDDTIPIEVLQKIAGNIAQVVFKIKDTDKDYSAFFKAIKRLNSELVILTDGLTDKQMSDLKLKYFDFIVVEDKQSDIDPKIINENTKYLSKKQFVSNAETFPSRFSSKGVDNIEQFILNDTSKQEIESFYIYE